MATVVVWVADFRQEIRQNRSAVQKVISISVMKKSTTNWNSIRPTNGLDRGSFRDHNHELTIFVGPILIQ